MSPRTGPRFRLDGAGRSARDGETLLAALARLGWPYLVRSIRYHRARGPFCGTGDCAGCLVRVNGRPNVRACRYVPQERDEVVCENSWPHPRFDLLGALDVLLPHGIDTLHGLRRPAWAAGIYQRVVRRLAGYGRLAHRSWRSAALEPGRVEGSCAIVGAGRSGRAVAAGLVREGLRPILLERERSVPAVEGVELLRGVTATFLPPPEPEPAGFTLLAFSEDGRGYVVRAPQVVVATGGYDASLLFEGSDRPGVVSADLALTVPELPLGRAVLVGGGDRALRLLERLGPTVCAVVAPAEIRPELAARASGLGVPLYPRCLLVRAEGRTRVRSVTLASRGNGGRFTLSCESVVLAHRRLPNAQLLFQAGAQRLWRGDRGAAYPDVAPDGRTSVPGLWAVGAAARPVNGAEDGADATVAGLLGRTGAVAGTHDERPDATPMVGYFRELLAEPRRGKWVVCPCEDVLLEEIEQAVRRGYRGIEVIKRYTGVGTGLCQGRYCLPDTLLLLAALEARSPSEVGTVTQRPPLVPTPLEALAGLRDEFAQEVVP